MTTANSTGTQYPIPTADIADEAVTYAKIQIVAAARLLGNPSGSPDSVQEIELGSNLSFAGNVLNATGGGGSFDYGLSYILSKGIF